MLPGGLCRFGPPKASETAPPVSAGCWNYVLFPVPEANGFPNPLSQVGECVDLGDADLQRAEDRKSQRPPEVSKRVTTVPLVECVRTKLELYKEGKPGPPTDAGQASVKPVAFTSDLTTLLGL